MRRWSAPIVACLALVTPTAVALTGDIVAHGAVALPRASELSLFDAEIFLDDAASVDSLEIESPRIVVHRFDFTTVEAGNVQLVADDSRATYSLTGVSARLAGSKAPAWIGSYSRQPATAHIADVSFLRLQGATDASLGPAMPPEREPDPRLQSYGRAYSRPIVSVHADGDVVLTGSFAIKLSGIDLRVEARENTSTLTTSMNTEGTQARHQWAFLELEDARVHLRSSSAIELVGTYADALWSGEASVQDPEGQFHEGARGYSDLPPQLLLAGDITADLRPLATGGLGVALGGELTATNAGARIALPAGAERALAWPLGALLLVAVAVGSYAIASRRGRSAPRLTPEGWVGLADDAAARREFGLAAEYVERALAAAPKHPRLLVDRAFYLAEAGEFDAAVDAYAQAARAGEDGQAEFLLTRLYLSIGDERRAAGWFVEALAKEPSFALEAADDPLLDALRSDASVQAALSRAEGDLRPR